MSRESLDPAAAKEPLFSLLLIEFSGDTPRPDIADFTAALARSVRKGAREKGVVGVTAQAPTLPMSSEERLGADAMGVVLGPEGVPV